MIAYIIIKNYQKVVNKTTHLENHNPSQTQLCLFSPHYINHFYIISMVLLRIPTAVQPVTGIEGFKYQASHG